MDHYENIPSTLGDSSLEFCFRTTDIQDIREIVTLSKCWEMENIIYGYVACEEATLSQMDVYAWVCSCNGKIIGYTFGYKKVSEGMCTIPQGVLYFEVEDLYVVPGLRSYGIGSKLLSYVENELKRMDIEYTYLTSATKAYERSIKFYTSNEYNMWTMTFFKKL